MKRVLLLLPTTGYRNEDFLAAAKRLEVEVIGVANYCHQLAPSWGMSPIRSVPFDQPVAALKQLQSALGRKPDAVLAVDDSGLDLAALLCEYLYLPGNSPEAVRRTRDKLAFRDLLQGAGLHYPDFFHLDKDAQALSLPPPLRFPVVVKARRLSASRGVIRADTLQAYARAVHWVRGIQAKADRDAAALGVIVENFIPGSEHVLEGLLRNGRLRVLALIDKPDPLDGPYFEETMYVTPSRLTQERQAEIAQTVQRACTLAGLESGPIHAEMRVNEQGVWLLEVAARSIGGLCGRMLRPALGMSLEELILRDALNFPVPEVGRSAANGVMMIPIPRHGIFQGVRGRETALALAGISDIRITASPGQLISAPPEGAGYLGFIFAQGTSPDEVESGLRRALQELQFDIQTEIPLSERRIQEPISK
ncbi:MAG: ATP-grasp domain-containing protein [Burkholderiales bacterium]|nr:ATP-grasp domain-containing protein [Burkholderiales bacterium]